MMKRNKICVINLMVLEHIQENKVFWFGRSVICRENIKNNKVLGLTVHLQNNLVYWVVQE